MHADQLRLSRSCSVKQEVISLQVQRYQRGVAWSEVRRVMRGKSALATKRFLMEENTCLAAVLSRTLPKQGRKTKPKSSFAYTQVFFCLHPALLLPTSKSSFAYKLVIFCLQPDLLCLEPGLLLPTNRSSFAYNPVFLCLHPSLLLPI